MDDLIKAAKKEIEDDGIFVVTTDDARIGKDIGESFSLGYSLATKNGVDLVKTYNFDIPVR
jgi:hypothetical protein